MKSSLKGFLLGSLLGTAVGLLLAPQAGNETRRKIKNEIQKVKETALETVQQSRAGAVEKIRDASDQLEKLRTETNQRIKALHEITESTLEKQKKVFQQGLSDAKKTIQKT